MATVPEATRDEAPDAREEFISLFLDNQQRTRQLRDSVRERPLSVQQKTRLYELCVALDAVPAPEDDDESEDEKRPRKRARSAGLSKVRHQWLPVMNMEELSLPPAIARLLRDDNAAPQDFMNDGEPLSCAIDASEEDEGRAFMQYFEYLRHLGDREGRDRIRTNYMWLFYFDFVKHLRPNATGRRVGKLMLEEARQLLSNFEHLQISVEEVYGHLDEWSRCGKKLDALCSRFGEGSIFFLHECFSLDFILNKSPQKGQHFNEAMSHLEGLGLREMAAESGANAMASRIRRHLISPFNRA